MTSGVVAAVSAAPVSASLAGVAPAPPVDPIAKTTAAATAAPPNANQMKPNGEATPRNAIAATTASEAPALMPSRPGSASGFRVAPCRSAATTPERGARP